MLVAHRSGRMLALITALAACGAGCGDEDRLQDRLHDKGSDGDAAPSGDDAGSTKDGGAGRRDGGSKPDDLASTCVPAVASDPLRARSNVMARGTKTSAAGVFTSDLYGVFASNCGGCHVDNSLGGFHVTPATFATAVTREAFDRITSDDPKVFMPPSNRKPFSKLAESDPLVELAHLLDAWLEQDRPEGVFYPAGSATVGDDADRYRLSMEVGTQMTNLGNCIPKAEMVREAPEMDSDLDAMFEKADALPDRLEQTDITTLDAEALAKQGVVAFAPAYTLWADNAKKIRMVRVPHGKSIEFDEKKQTFEIPPNTRFYKTFLKHVVDLRGNESYRKMETRLIVSRPDKIAKDGSQQHTALFGTYVWNEEETEAVLLKDPLRDGKPFRDHLVTYVTDEQAADALITTGPDDLQKALSDANLSRTYAVPGSERCIQCHMGAPTKSFILGFTPLQINRRKLGEGGVIEPAERDELNQLQRLIDYGVITGMKSAKEVVTLEESEGKRKPRNDHELDAQGYMLGNCAHCHNPTGYPSRVASELRDDLNFFPSEDGGIFQFPLEKFSRRIFRGTNQNVPQPYITPSLYDRPPGWDLPPSEGMDGEAGAGDPTNSGAKVIIFVGEQSPGKAIPAADLLAPWRSLIYRNVDAPFTYEEDFSIYPHMPMNTPGYDCRARQLLGSWMVSVPARLKPDPLVPANTPPTSLDFEAKHHAAQPFEEVLPEDEDYSRMRRIGEGRVARFKQSMRYTDCPDPTLVDIVDPAVVRGAILVPQAFTRQLTDDEGNVVGAYSLRAPERPHYAVTDLTNPPGDWFPRRPDWSQVLVDLNFDGIDNIVLKQRVQTLRGIGISDALRAFATAELPFGLWKEKDGCDFDDVPQVEDFAGDARARWMDVVEAKPDARVYMISPGAEVFTQICANCHGPEGDSKGRLAATIADMTGGRTRVANLRDGFFGPASDPGKNRERVFGEVKGDVSAEVWAARYLMFMGLGGTTATIPKLALQTIRNGTILGEKRPNPASLDVSSANMLSVPFALCRATIPGDPYIFSIESGDVNYAPDVAYKTPLVEKNGDVEMWKRLCALDNEAVPVRVVTTRVEDGKVTFEGSAAGLRSAAAYPADAPVGTSSGKKETGIQPGNSAPWCISRPASEEDLAVVKAAWEAHTTAGDEPPYCPEAFLADAANEFTTEDVDRWATRGAMNAGMSVFLYLDALTKGEKKHPVNYDRCEQLAP